jgi:predicted transcriptional regulator
VAITSAQYTVGTTASIIVADSVAAEEVHLHTTGGLLYVGGPDVTTANGLRLDSGDKITFNTHVGAMYAVTNTGTTTVYVAVVEQ